MSTNYFEQDIPDDDPTDELPILTDVVLADSPSGAAHSSDDETRPFTVPRHPTSPGMLARDDRAAELQQDIADRDAKLGTLETELARLEASWRATSTEVADRDAEITSLRTALAERDAAIALHAEAAESTRKELQARDQQIVQLTEEIEAVHATAASLEDNARALELQITKLEGVPKDSKEPSQSSSDTATIAQLREENAALAQHIENRNLIWRERAALVEEKSVRIRELELEISQRLERQRVAEDQAEAEANQANEYRAKLIAVADPIGTPIQAPQNQAQEPTDGPTKLRNELKRAVALQASAGEDPEELRRLEDLEAAIRHLELEMGANAKPPSAAEQQHDRARLICLTSQELGPYILDDTELMIGRGSHCGIRIMTHYVSREHARITGADGNCVIEDAGSRNGVFVNSVQVVRQTLEDNDLITIGDTQFRYRASDRGAS